MTNFGDRFDDLRIIDTDSHFTEPANLWTSRVPASLVDKVPTQKTSERVTGWFIGDELWTSIGGNTLSKGNQKLLGAPTAQPFDAVDKSAWSVKERLELLDTIGIWSQIIYPNGIGFASNHVFAIEDHELRTLILQTYNDFFVDIQEESGQRLLPQALLPVWDMDLTIKEMTRLLDRGIRGFTLSDKPEMIGLPQLVEPYFEPMWDLFNESGAVANFHIAAGATRAELQALRNPDLAMRGPNGATAPPAWNGFGHQRRSVAISSQGSMSNMRIMVNLCLSNLFDRFPKLKIVSAESGVGWVPFMLEFLEFLYDETITNGDEVAYAKHRPSDYFREHIYAMFWFENASAKHAIDVMGPNNILIETDIPHPASLYPGPRAHFLNVLADYDDHTVRRIMQDNAAELYNIDLSPLAPLAGVAAS